MQLSNLGRCPIWVRSPLLLTLLGANGLKVYESFVFVLAGDGRQIVPVLDRFTSHFEPRRSEVFERFKFFKRHKLPGENFDSWLIELRTLIKSWDYGVGADSVLRDQIVLGVVDPLVREKLLFKKIYCSSRLVTLYGRVSHPRPNSRSSVVLRLIILQPESGTRGIPPSSSRPPHAQNQSAGQRSSSNSPPVGQQYVQCAGCGHRHKKDQCQAVNIWCHGCGILGHFVNRCSAAPHPPSHTNPVNRRGLAILNVVALK